MAAWWRPARGHGLLRGRDLANGFREWPGGKCLDFVGREVSVLATRLGSAAVARQLPQATGKRLCSGDAVCQKG